MKRLLFVALAATAFVSAQASFELALVLDVDHANSRADIKRFDVNTGAYLGSFGGGYINYTANNSVLTLDQANSAVYVTQSSAAVLKFNYNTGEYLGEFYPVNTMIFGVSLQSNTLIGAWTGNTSFLTRYSTSGTYEGSYYGGFGTGLRGAVTYNGMLFAPDSVNKQLLKWNYGALGSTATVAGAMPGWNSGYGWEVEAISNRLYWSDQYNNLINANVNASGVITGNSLISFAGQGITFSQGLGKGHGDMLYLGGTDAGRANGKVCRYNSATGQFRGTFGAGYLHDPSSIDVVLAPEPSVWFGLAFGVGLVAKRRRASFHERSNLGV